jgi:glycosyltransferase involved in cell wall biosynthesis/putative flippase GtrA
VKIAIVTETWLPSTDGIVTRLRATVRELHRAGHQVLIVAPAGSVPGDTGFEGVQVRTVATVGARFLYDGKRWGLPMPRVGRYLREFDPDVVHVVNPVLLGIAAILAARRQGRTLVGSYHTDIARYAAHYRLGWLRPVIWALLRLLHGRAHLNLATSSATCAELNAHRVTGVQLWPRGVELDLFRPGIPIPREQRSRPTALYVGRLAPEKGLHRLAPLAAADSGLDLVLVGDGPARSELAHAYSATFTGTLRGEALADAYRRADVFVFPSTTETLGLVLLEALASGLPVVAADSPASRETLANCTAVRLFPADQPERLLPLARDLLDSAPPEALARSARLHAEQWSWTTATERLVGYYREAKEAAASSRATPAGMRTRWQLTSFLGVGVLNALLDVLVFNALLLVGPGHSPFQLTVYNTVAVMVAIANSYWWNSRLTFRTQRATTDRRRLRQQRVGFLAQAGLNIAINDAVVAGLSAALAHQPEWPMWLGNNLAKTVAMVTASLISFLTMKSLVFRHHSPVPTRVPQQTDRSEVPPRCGEG